MARVLTGIQSTGVPHLGNILGAIIPAIELSKNPAIQEKLQNEVDNFFTIQGMKEIEYDDFKRLPYMTRCIMETLRLWTAIPNGTFRELEEDEYIEGNVPGKKVKILKGTYIQIPNWTRHRNPELWGTDANKFNPDRNFKDDELWNNTVINSYHYQSLVIMSNCWKFQKNIFS